MKAFIITGTSSGIGKELTEQLLQDDDNLVIGISRSNTLEHPNFKHISLDLNDVVDIEGIEFPKWKNATQVSLIHNAGWIGPMHKMGILSNHFIASFKESEAQKVILSISSGASHSPVEGWNTYCSAKAGLDMLSKCIDEEHEDIINLSIAPGKVDTPMQNDIRFADEKEFPRLKEFQGYHEKGELSKVAEVVEKYINILTNPSKHKNTTRISEI
jgi:benzil reductase ((S)-benzoin forming)